MRDSGCNEGHFDDIDSFHQRAFYGREHSLHAGYCVISFNLMIRGLCNMFDRDVTDFRWKTALEHFAACIPSYCKKKMFCIYFERVKDIV